MNKGTFYLAGPMRLVNQNEEMKWRREAKQYLSELSFKVLLPTHRYHRSDKEKVTQDLRDIQLATGLLAWLPDEVAAIGTSMEVFYAAHTLHRPVVVWGKRDSISPWLSQHCICITTTLGNALLFIKENLELFTELDWLRNVN